MPLSFSLSDRVLAVVVVAGAVVFRLYLEEGHNGGYDLDRGRVDVVDDAEGLLPVHVPLLCYCLRVMIAIAIVGSRFSCSCSCCCCGVTVALGGKDVMVTKMLIEDVSMLLILLKDC